MKLYLLLLLLLTICNSAFAFKINPFTEYDSQKNEFMKLEIAFPDPIHENLVARSTKKVKDDLLPQPVNIFVNQVAQGVRWNDDPLSMLKNRSIEFGTNYEKSCDDDVKNEIDEEWDYLYRTHCGDMQYLHAMRSNDDKNLDDTKHRILMWLEFTYKVSSGTIPTNYRLRSVHDLMSEKNATIFKEEITDNGEKYKCKYNDSEEIVSCAEVETLFSFECNRVMDFPRFWKTKPKCESKGNVDKELIRNIALGSALHVLQDSMSDSHVDRIGDHNELCSPMNRQIGIIKYHNFNEQSSSRHGKADKKMCKESDGELNIVSIGADFITQSLTDRKNGTNNWDNIRKDLDEVIFAHIEVDQERLRKNKYLDD